MRKFKVSFNLCIFCDNYGIIELDQQVIDMVDDTWRSYFYDYTTPEEIAAHIAYNMVIHKLRLDEIEGFGDCNNGWARMIDNPSMDWEVKAEEIIA